MANGGRSGVGARPTEGVLLRHALLCSRELPQCVPAGAMLQEAELLQEGELLSTEELLPAGKLLPFGAGVVLPAECPAAEASAGPRVAQAASADHVTAAAPSRNRSGRHPETSQSLWVQRTPDLYWVWGCCLSESAPRKGAWGVAPTKNPSRESRGGKANRNDGQGSEPLDFL